MTASGQTDVVVIGGGPAGATVSTLIAQQGHRVVLLERDKFPRFHIGESLIPETYWVFERLGMLDKMRASRFVKKHSVQFVGSGGKLSQPFYFDEHKPHECSQTWQVLRSEFDKMMLDNAREHGVEVHEQTRVLEVLFDGEQACGVRAMDAAGATRQLAARVVVDASGQSTLLASRLKLRVPDPQLNKGAVWTYYEGGQRDTGRDEGATLVLLTSDRQGWFWYIPLHNDLVSIGVVASFDYLFSGRGDHEKIFHEELEKCGSAKQRIADARRVTHFFATKDFSYRARQAAGDGWVLVGDAFAFLDPLYSSGVLLALKSGQLAADAICAGLVKNDTGAAQLGSWTAEFNRGMDRMRRMVCEFYGGFNFGGFVKAHPEFKGHVTDLLIGDLFKPSLDEMFAPMDAMKQQGSYADAAGD